MMLHKTGVTVQQQSNVESWGKFNLGRRLFTHMADYDFAMAKLLDSLIPKKKVIVEYGCGDGIWLEYLAKKHSGKQFIGVEWNKKLYSYALNKRIQPAHNRDELRSEVTLYNEDATCFCVDCDLWYAFGVVEHFNESSDVMRLWTQHLSPNGFAVVTAPNLLNTLYVAERCKLPLEQLEGKDEVVVDLYGFEQLWSHNRFLKKVMDAGLEILMFRIMEEMPNERGMLTVAFKRGEKFG